jgi:hypothetical protein
LKNSSSRLLKYRSWASLVLAISLYILLPFQKKLVCH